MLPGRTAIGTYSEPEKAAESAALVRDNVRLILSEQTTKYALYSAEQTTKTLPARGYAPGSVADAAWASLGLDARAQKTPEQFGLACVRRVEITQLNVYEFQVAISTLSSVRPHVLRFRCDTWRSMHVWVNGLGLLSKLARAGLSDQGEGLRA